MVNSLISKDSHRDSNFMGNGKSELLSKNETFLANKNRTPAKPGPITF